MNTSKVIIASPEDSVIMFDIYGEELKNSNYFSTPSQNKSLDEKDPNEEECYHEEEKKLSDDKENQPHPSLITPYKRKNNRALIRSPLYDITPCPKTKQKDSCNVTPKTLDYLSTPKMSSLKKKKELREIKEMR